MKIFFLVRFIAGWIFFLPTLPILAMTHFLELPLFPNLFIKGNYKVDIQQDPAYVKTKITVTTNEALLKDFKIETRKQGIQISHPNHRINKNAIAILIHTSGIENVFSQGNSQINISRITANQFTLNLQGNDEIYIGKTKTKQFLIKTKGNTKIVISGESSSLNLDLLGHSKIDALHLIVDKAILNSKGLAEIQLNVKEKLERNLEGRASLSIKGHPLITGQMSGILELKELK